jgi:hypothetical protein
MTLGPRTITSPATPGGTALAVGVDDRDLDADGGCRPTRAGRLRVALLVGHARDDRRGLGGPVELRSSAVGNVSCARRNRSVVIGEPA